VFALATAYALVFGVSAQAASFTPFDSAKEQSITLLSPIETNRPDRNGVVTNCGSVKTPTTLPGTYHYNAYTHTSDLNNPVCVQVTVTAACASSSEIFAQSYNSAFEPASINNNYLGDMGRSPLPPTEPSESYSYLVEAGHTFIDVVNEVTEGLGCTSYEISWASEAPWNSVSPTISGHAAQGQTLNASRGTWSGSPAFAYQWQQCSSAGASCSPIEGEVDPAYTPTAADVGHTLRAVVFAVNTATSSISSTNTAVTAVVTVPPVVTPPPAPPITPPAPVLAPFAPVFTSGPTQSTSVWRAGNAVAHLSSKKAQKPPVGTKFAFGLNEAATVQFSFARVSAGRFVGGKCTKESKGNARKKKCSVSRAAGALSVSARQGNNAVQFQGVLSATSKLTPGKYTVTITAVNATGQKSATKTLSFTIVK